MIPNTRIWAVTLGVYALTGTAAGAPVSSEAQLFTIAKSENKNRVQYVIRLTADCVPTPGTPVYAYWRMLEQGPTRVAPLLAQEGRAYGLASQQVVPPLTAGAAGAVRVALAAVPARPVLVETWRTSDGTCRALATVDIAGAPAHLVNVYVRLKFPLSVEYLLLQGWSMDGTRRVEEKLGG